MEPFILKALERGDTKGVFQSDQKPDLSLTPVPRFDLTFMMAPGCYMDIDFPVLAPWAVNAAGELKVAWVIPSTAMPGDKIYIQNFVIAPGANGAGALTSNAMAFLF